MIGRFQLCRIFEIKIECQKWDIASVGPTTLQCGNKLEYKALTDENFSLNSHLFQKGKVFNFLEIKK